MDPKWMCIVAITFVTKKEYNVEGKLENFFSFFRRNNQYDASVRVVPRLNKKSP